MGTSSIYHQSTTWTTRSGKGGKGECELTYTLGHLWLRLKFNGCASSDLNVLRTGRRASLYLWLSPSPSILVSVCPTLCLIFRPCWLMNRTCKLICCRFLNFFFLVWLIWGRFCDVLVPLSVADICKPLNCFISLPFTVLSLSLLFPQNSLSATLSSLSPSSFVA